MLQVSQGLPGERLLLNSLTWLLVGLRSSPAADGSSLSVLGPVGLSWYSSQRGRWLPREQERVYPRRKPLSLNN